MKAQVIAIVVAVLIVIPLISADVKLIDVSVDGSACIFKVNDKIVVVKERNTQVVDGYSIYVQEAYPLHSQAKDNDACKALVSFSGKTPRVIAEGAEDSKNKQDIKNLEGSNSAVNNNSNPEGNNTLGREYVEHQAASEIVTVQDALEKTNAITSSSVKVPAYWVRLISFWKRLFS